MKNWTNSLLLTLLFVWVKTSDASAQQQAPGQWLVRLQDGMKPQALMSRLESASFLVQTTAPSAQPSCTLVAGSMNIWLIQQKNSGPELLEWLLRQPEIEVAQPNHLLSLRCNLLPNDPLFFQQWQLLNDGSGGGVPNADLDAELAWDITTGGLSVAGDTIVVAVIDGGIDKTHPDLMGNLWRNTGETPNDGIDNDGNGFTDDYEGWNIFAQNDHIQGITATHGTPVSGIIGAAGNNEVGVTGVNWNVKIMFIAGGNLESEVLSAYDYILQSRRRYNESGGAQGAFVVAANGSWGIDYGMPSDAPLWCSAFDALGNAGVLSVAATANNAVDVDVAGDLPTTCPSDFLVAVTSLNKQDEKAPNAAWGKNSIDLGAYGDGVFTTSAGHQYDFHAGTSFAAPQVSGAIGLLYAAPCPELIALAKTDPKAAALWAKNLLLNSTAANTSMQDRTATGGRLQLFQMLQQYQAQCAACPPPFSLKATNVSPYSTQLKWSEVPGVQQVTLRWRKTGTTSWTLVENAANNYLLEGLLPCAKYEFSLKCTCQSGGSSGWSPSVSFITLGCCSSPGFAASATAVDQGALITWSHSYDYSMFKIVLHPTDTAQWLTLFSEDTSLLVPELRPCTVYDILVQGWCADAWVTLGPVFQVLTKGCGTCLEVPYCAAEAHEAQEEWIMSVRIGNWEYDSGWGGGGYQNLAATQLDKPQIAPQSQVGITLTPGFWGAPYKEYFRVFIDYNLDGDFDDNGELAFDPGYAQEGVVVGTLTAPDFAQTGATRMRVMMKYAQNSQTPPEPCELYDFGQVEDYCVDLIDPQTSAPISKDSVFQLKIYPQPATNWVWIGVPDHKYNGCNLRIWDVAGRLKLEDHLRPLRNNALYLNTTHWPTGIYIVAIESQGSVLRGKLMKR